MKSILKTILLLLIPVFVNAQTNVTESLRQALQNAPNDSARYQVYRQFVIHYDQVNIDSALYYSEKSLVLAKNNNNRLSEVEALDFKGWNLLRLGRYASSLQCFIRAFELAQDPKSEKYTWELGNNAQLRKSRLAKLALTHNMFAHLMGSTDDTPQQLIHFKKAKKIAEDIGDSDQIGIVDVNLELTYVKYNKLDSALIFEKDAERISIQSGHRAFLSHILSGKADIYFKKGDKELAKQFYYEGIQSGEEQNNLGGLVENYFGLTKCYLAENNKDSSLYYAKKALTFGVFSNTVYNIGTAYENLYHSYQLSNQFDSAFKYQGLALVTKDSLYNDKIKNLSAFQNLSFKEQLRLQELEKERAVFQYRARTYAMLGGLGVVLLIALILYRNNRQKQKANLVLEKALTNLKATQQQLIQSEKMASLGELTAGIAHEIQNPLNFVNNFSEVNTELIAEMKAAIDKGNFSEIKNIATDIEENEQKINHHGKRADAIVKGMLQHSRANSGRKESADINALADEYLRLSYHGLRAKDKDFNADFKTDYDESIGKVEVVPQDIGRVLLNLYNNAFYAASLPSKGGFNKNPTVWVSTKKEGDKILISVRDNGPGIPQKIADKIFQPFFTTKPTGQGTGLGLSLSYDIIKAHGGELKVETKEGEGSTFIILIPLDS